MRTRIIVATAGLLLLVGVPVLAPVATSAGHLHHGEFGDLDFFIGVGNPKHVCDDRPFAYSDTTVVGLTRVRSASSPTACGVGQALVVKVFRANPDLPGPALPGWNCHGVKGQWFQGHCHDTSVRKHNGKRKRRLIHWWLNE